MRSIQTKVGANGLTLPLIKFLALLACPWCLGGDSLGSLQLFYLIEGVDDLARFI